MMKESKIRRVLAWIAVFVMLLGLAPSSAPAEESGTVTRVTIRPTRSIVLTNFIVDPDDADVTYADGVLIVNGGTVTIRNADPATPTSDRIEIAGNASVTLAGVNIDASVPKAPAIRVRPEATATITLENENFLTGGDNYAGLEVGWDSEDNYANLTINGEGTLNANGGKDSAAIGGSKNNKGLYGNITIENGIINATGNGGGAGIGSSNNPNGGASNGSYKHFVGTWGTITINDGTINATGSNSAGIGGGNHVDSGKIVINGGTITATGASGIGTGTGSSKNVQNDADKGPGYYFATIEINGGNITATATGGDNWGGAGIGGGAYCDAEITITGGTITATGGSCGSGHNSLHHGGAGIGAGYEGHADVTISGGSITASTGKWSSAAAIGSGGTPNSNPSRGETGRSTNSETVFLTSTSVKIYGGDVTAKVHADARGGAGIGGGTGADRVSVLIAGGDVRAEGAKSSETDMLGGAGIGSGINGAGKKASGMGSAENAKYQVDTDVSVTISGGTVTAIGGWGAAGIGSGSNNKMAESITITGGDVQAYSDGTKFAIDTRLVDGDTTTSRTEGRTITAPMLQGTYVHAYTDGISQNPEGLKSIVITDDTDGSEERELTKMPDGYRSFAATVSAAGNYNVYTDAASIGQGGGRYFAETQQEIYHSFEVEDNIAFKVTGSELCDNFYLYPVKTFIAQKEIAAADGTDLSGLDLSIEVRLVVQSSKAVVDTGTIKIEGGVPQNRVCFVNVPDNIYELWEMNGDEKMSAGTVVGTYELKKIETKDSSGGSTNNGTIDDEKWTDGVTIVNTYGKVPEKISVSGEKTWDDENNRDGIRPAQITVNLLADGRKAASKTVKPGKDGRWTYTFSDLDEYNGEKKITYTVSEEAVKGYTAEYDGMDIVNRHEPEKVDVSGEKTWDDDNNRDGIRPAQITVNLLANGKKTASRTVSAGQDGRWTYTFSGLDRYKDGKEITYTVREDPVAGYTASYDGTKIVNRHTPATRDISGVKTWADQNNAEKKRPKSITVRLLADGTEVDSRKVSAADKWRWSFTGLPRYKDGKEIVYTLKEDPVAGYKTIITGFNVTNTLNPGNKDQEGKIHRLTVRYWYEQVDGRTAAPSFTGLYREGAKYRVKSPAIQGWTVDLEVVRGTMGTEDIVLDVIYIRNPYTLTIHYVDLFGNTVAPDHTEVLYAGDGYYVESPVIEGYRTQTPLVSGTMPARDVTVTVIYYPQKVVHRRVTQVVFEEYETPLGVGSQSMDVGECVE